MTRTGRMTGKTIDNLRVFSDAIYNTTPKPHAIDQADVDQGSFFEHSLTYTCFNKVKTVSPGIMFRILSLFGMVIVDAIFGRISPRRSAQANRALRPARPLGARATEQLRKHRHEPAAHRHLHLARHIGGWEILFG